MQGLIASGIGWGSVRDLAEVNRRHVLHGFHALIGGHDHARRHDGTPDLVRGNIDVHLGGRPGHAEEQEQSTDEAHRQQLRASDIRLHLVTFVAHSGVIGTAGSCPLRRCAMSHVGVRLSTMNACGVLCMVHLGMILLRHVVTRMGR